MRPLFCVSLAALMALAFLLSACGEAVPPPAASEILTAMVSAAEDSAQPIPDGVIRLTAAPMDSPNHLTETFFSALYGEAARGMLEARDRQSPPLQDVALYLSVSPYPWELGIFRCADGDTAREVATLCHGRLDTLSRGFRESDGAAAASRGRVVVEGNWVLLVLCEDPAPVLEAARRLVG